MEEGDHKEYNKVDEKQMNWVSQRMSEMRHTKIMCTLSPKSNKQELILDLLKNGMDGVRINIHHGQQECTNIIKNIKKITEENGCNVPISLQLSSRERIYINLNESEVDDIELKMGDEFIMTTQQEVKASNIIAPITSRNFISLNIQKGDSVLIDIGNIIAEVTEITPDGTQLKCLIKNDGFINHFSTVHFPDSIKRGKEQIDGEDEEKGSPLPSSNTKHTVKELVCEINYAVENDVDYIILPIHSKKMLPIAKKALASKLTKGQPPVKIIAKIENSGGLKILPEIIQEVECILFAGAVLCTELGLEKVVWEQKRVISLCNLYGKPIILASQFLDTMIRSHKPSRAEVTDIHQTVSDGADCLLLNNETSMGMYPIEALKTMANVCISAEQKYDYSAFFNHIMAHSPKPMTSYEAVASSTVKSSFNINSKFILILTRSGNAARSVAKYRPEVPVVSLSTTSRIAAQSNIFKSIIPYHTGRSEQLLFEDGEGVVNYLKEKGKVIIGELIVMFNGLSEGPPLNAIDSLKILKVL